MNKLIDFFSFFKNKIISPDLINDLIKLGISIVIAIVVYYIIRIFIWKYLDKIISSTKTNIDDILLETGAIKNIIYLVPILIVFILTKDLFIIKGVGVKLFYIILIVQSLRVCNKVIEAIEMIFSKLNNLKGKNIKILLQTFQIFISIIAVLLIITVLLDSSILKIISGVGAMAAVLMLIFKDTILSFSASFHISMNKLIELGDWIEMPSYGVDGDIVDISLNNVKVQNFDKTIVSIPKHKFLDTSFVNWKGMQISGGRRIKRNLYIDQSTITFCDKDDIERLEKIDVLSYFIREKIKEIENHNLKIPNDEMINNRTLTNIGALRYYIEHYLKNHKDIKKDFTLMVRQLEPTDKGLPLQLYCFTNTTNWIDYETIQADIFDHILSVLELFNLKVYQLPSGSDFNMK